jgi:drug/metabolite transporter (DMT)-like permease
VTPSEVPAIPANDAAGHRTSDTVLGAAAGLGSAALFGISAPIAKLLLPRVDPWVLAGLLYLGAGLGLTLIRVAQSVAGTPGLARRERLQRRDMPLLVSIAVIGGGVGPVLILVGLRLLSGVAGALLLNLEAVFTMVLALTLFRERLTRLEAVAAVVVVGGAVLLSSDGGRPEGEALGVLAVAAGCFAWAIDNNLTARLSRRNAIDLVQFKALTAGAGNLALAAIAGRSLPDAAALALSLGLGFVSYGLSIVLDVYALRHVGAARESAFFATAPFVGAVAAVPLLREPVAARETAAGLVMAAGVVLLVLARRQSTSTSTLEKTF